MSDNAHPSSDADVYTITLNGKQYVVEVRDGGEPAGASPPAPAAPAAASGEAITAPLAGNIFKVNVRPGDAVEDGDVVTILEAMKMETEVRASSAGTVSAVKVSEGDSVAVGDVLIEL
ncbi:hypothetical protein BOX17_13530 [Halomonas aestuarii]|uniref:Lipoyl-binding domain-containing protein n=1 Tax=Halomonas aestuarii TaxID=1897729 RepID=A0A1J0VIM2_9GAMM|nr:hypothetical protein BOX17_13530 [Halomonas aestuarii]